MSASPLVSICIPSFNHARFIGTAVESALGQTYQNVEIVIVDDGSSDGSLGIAQSYADRYPDLVRVFVHPGNAHRGISATANLAFRISRGEYWCGLSSDDAFYPDKVERQVSFLQQHPGVGMIYGRVMTIDEAGRPLHSPRTLDLSRQVDPLVRLLEGNCIYGQTVMSRRECFEKVGLHDEGLVYSDWELWIRILAHYEAAFMPRQVAYYRVHSRNTSVGQPPDVQLERAVAVMRSIERKAPAVGGALIHPRVQAFVYLQLAYLTFCGEDEDQGRYWLCRAFKIIPLVSWGLGFLAAWLARRQLDLPAYVRLRPRNFLVWFALQAAETDRLASDLRARLNLTFTVALGALRYIAGRVAKYAWGCIRSFRSSVARYWSGSNTV